ncbi:MAG: anti-sigma factor antagonist [Bacteroidetes bacterium]|nr:MAG: anti-sigma factor antagonist [Bacteroidota bacterium]
MKVNCTNEGKFHIIAIEGDLDASSSILLDTVLEEAIEQQKHYILIDCLGLNYISSPGIGVLTSRLDDCEKNNTTIVLFSVSEKVFNVFNILGLDQLLPIKKNKEDAKSFSDGI